MVGDRTAGRCQLAQVNVAIPVDCPTSARFVAALDPVSASADAAPGFVWPLQTDEGDATDVRGFADERIIVNMSVWESIETLTPPR